MSLAGIGQSIATKDMIFRATRSVFTIPVSVAFTKASSTELRFAYPLRSILAYHVLPQARAHPMSNGRLQRLYRSQPVTVASAISAILSAAASAQTAPVVTAGVQLEEVCISTNSR